MANTITLKPPVELESAYAQYMLGNIFRYGGHGVNPDYTKALTWYEKAAQQGYLPAQILLGDMYYQGLGVEKDWKKAAKWYHQAANVQEPKDNTEVNQKQAATN